MELKGKVEESLQQGRENGNDLKMLRRELAKAAHLLELERPAIQGLSLNNC